jgi:hypothetical protein
MDVLVKKEANRKTVFPYNFIYHLDTENPAIDLYLAGFSLLPLIQL